VTAARSLVVAVAVGLAGCGIVTPFHESRVSGYVLTASAGVGGEAGGVHTAVLEYVFSSPDAPFVDYYAIALARGLARGDTNWLGPATTELAAGGKPTPAHYARARARQLAPHINVGLRDNRLARGSVTLSCCRTVDRDAGVLLATAERVSAELFVNRSLAVVRLNWRDGRQETELTWDLSRLPEAFDPAATLDYETVMRRAVPLHRMRRGGPR
jgi:hypothetical protein